MNVKALKLRLLFSFGDVFHLTLAFLLAYRIMFFSLDISDKYLFLLVIVNLSWLLLGFFFGLFDYERASRFELVLSNLLKAVIVHALITSTLLFSLKTNSFSYNHLYYTFGLSYLILFVWRIFSVFFIKKYRRLGYNYKEIVIIGAAEKSTQLAQFFLNNEHGYKLQAFFYSKSSNKKLSCPCFHIDELEEFCKNNRVEEIYYSDSIYDETLLMSIIKFCDDNMIRLKITPDFSSFKQRKINIDLYGAIPVITLRDEPLQDEFNRFIKRVFDIIFSLFVIVFILSWLTPIVGLIIKLTSEGPVFFVQRRSGLDNKEFNCYKFRTMCLNRLSDVRQAYKDDPRITKFGRFLRRTSIDEMPQFFNTLIGNMSVVGPRPHMLKHTKSYSEIIDGYMVRQLVFPGITGAAQAYGFRGETRNVKDMEDRVKYDVWYIENWSLLLDVKLISLTIINLFKTQENAV